MFSRPHTFNKMEERTASSGRSQEYEKHDGNTLEMVTSQTPVHEQDKPQLSQVGSGENGVVVHEKVSLTNAVMQT